MLVKDILVREAEEIICLGCGNCCPKSCGAKNGNSCLIHPSIPGNEQKYRGLNCSQPPVFFALNMGVACLAVLMRVKELTGDTFEVVEHLKNGCKFIKNFGPFEPSPLIESDFSQSINREV